MVRLARVGVFALLLPLLLAPPAGQAAPPRFGVESGREPLEVFQQRRQQLAAEHADGLILLLGYRSGEGQTGRDAFRQENNFYYLSGWNEPGAAMLLTPAQGRRPYRETLFLPTPTAREVTWNGERLDPKSPEAAAATGFTEVLPLSELEAAVRRERGRVERAWVLASSPAPDELLASAPDATPRLSTLLGETPQRDLRPTIERMRRVKSPSEIELIEEAVTASGAAHRAALDRLRPGLAEYEIFAAMSGAMIRKGALRTAYPPIIASGRNALYLHYNHLQAPLEAGDLVLIDVGGEYGHYAADITRTLPVAGKFSERQREIYEHVLAVQQQVIAAVKPGMTLAGAGEESLTRLAREAFEERERGLSRNFPHAVGHYVGLQVHDPGSLHEPLEPGMIITIEPGLYLPREGMGVRIEDMLEVTVDGSRLLSAEIPKLPAEIEAALQQRSRR